MGWQPYGPKRMVRRVTSTGPGRLSSRPNLQSHAIFLRDWRHSKPDRTARGAMAILIRAGRSLSRPSLRGLVDFMRGWQLCASRTIKLIEKVGKKCGRESKISRGCNEAPATPVSGET